MSHLNIFQTKNEKTPLKSTNNFFFLVFDKLHKCNKFVWICFVTFGFSGSKNLYKGN
jgi:hypothetical protein